VEESTDSYHWILQLMQEMEPRWNVSKLQILFGDHKVTSSLMASLGIQETCLLRGDYYHNMIIHNTKQKLATKSIMVVINVGELGLLWLHCCINWTEKFIKKRRDLMTIS
jgi:hypothetical protein